MQKRRTGFTIVELLIVIVIIAVLAALTLVVFSSLQRRAGEAAVKSDLKNASTVLAGDNVMTGTFPANLANANGGKGVNASTGNEFAYSYYSSSNEYCLSGTSSRLSTGFRVTQSGRIEPGVCAGHSSGGGGGSVTLSKPAWSAAQVSSLLTTPVNTTLGGRQFNVTATLSAGDATGSHIDGHPTFGYTVDGVGTATIPTPDMQITTGRTLTVRAAIQSGTFDTMQVFVSDAEATDFKVYAHNSGGAKLPVSAWVVRSQEYVGTEPASTPNPFTRLSDEISFTSIAAQNDDVMRVVIDRTTLDQATAVILETTSKGTGDWVQWAFMGRAL